MYGSKHTEGHEGVTNGETLDHDATSCGGNVRNLEKYEFLQYWNEDSS